MNSKEKLRVQITLPDGRVLDIDENNDVFSACLLLEGEKFIPAFHWLFNEVVSLGKRIKSLEEEKANSEDLYKKLGEVMMKTLWEFRSKTEW
ncbi:MAG: hypothetical protein PHS31_04370 [Victivallaceae bacterium]|nr:hypothetical protein [Victivallaceae bacterium]